MTGYYIVEYEQGGKARAEYGDGLLKRLAKRLSESDFSVSSLKARHPRFARECK